MFGCYIKHKTYLGGLSLSLNMKVTWNLMWPGKEVQKSNWPGQEFGDTAKQNLLANFCLALSCLAFLSFPFLFLSCFSLSPSLSTSLSLFLSFLSFSFSFLTSICYERPIEILEQITFTGRAVPWEARCGEGVCRQPLCNCHSPSEDHGVCTGTYAEKYARLPGSVIRR